MAGPALSTPWDGVLLWSLFLFLPVAYAHRADLRMDCTRWTAISCGANTKEADE